MISIRRYMDDPLFKNSFFMLINKGLVVITGFVFWILAAHFYDVRDIGIATALISGATLIVGFSTFGFEISLVRFLRSYDKSKAFYTCLFLTMGAAFTLALLYVIFVQYISPELVFIKEIPYAIIFILFAVISAIGLITSNTFIALRHAKYTFLQNALQVSTIPALLVLAMFGSLGIIGANFVGYFITYAIVFTLLTRYFIPFKPRIDREFLKKSFNFSFGNYIANILYSASFQALPIIVLNQCGRADAGIFYIAFTVGNFILQIPIALSVSFFVEGVYGENLRKNIKRSGTAMVLLLVPGILFFWIFGPQILGFFGSSYMAGTDLLRAVVLSSLVFALYTLFQPLLNIHMRVKTLILMNLLIMVLLLGLSYWLTPIYGILGVGIALIATFAIVDVVIIYLVLRWKWLVLGFSNHD